MAKLGTRVLLIRMDMTHFKPANFNSLTGSNLDCDTVLHWH